MKNKTNFIHATGSMDFITSAEDRRFAVVPTPRPPRKKAITAKQLLHAIDVAVKRALEQKSSTSYSGADCFVASLAGVISIYDQALCDKIYSVFGYPVDGSAP